MQLISVNVGKARAIQNAKSSSVTGIYKIAQTTPVQINWLGLEGDAICDTENHGGVDQAVYVYGTRDYDRWAQELGRALEPGTFGENLTISDLESARFAVGDQLRVGAVLLEVTSPRVPCVTLAARMGDPTFVKRFRYAERPGLYCRVLVPGAVSAGAPVSVELSRNDTITMRDMFRQYYEKNPG
jgi:MOSC domain-containing protein YiiM